MPGIVFRIFKGIARVEIAVVDLLLGLCFWREAPEPAVGPDRTGGAGKWGFCGDLAAGFTCKGRHFCPSCHQRRVRSTSDWIATAVCHEVPHRQFVFTIPKVLRGIFRKRRQLLSHLFHTATETLRDAFRTRLNLSEPMIQAARENFNYHPHGNRVSIQSADLRHEFPGVTSSLVLSVLTLQFTPIEYRQQIIRRVFESLAPGGAFILVEKVLGATAKLDEAFVNLFLQIKRENGYSKSQIDRKRLSLEGVLVPVTARWNEELLHQEGFTSVDCFWRHLNFAGWVAVKP
jgi:SAM-dependent methyltransferase